MPDATASDRPAQTSCISYFTPDTLWNTRYLDAAVEQLRALPAEAREHDVLDEDVARLSPLKAGHLNVLGRYAFAPSQPEGALRPLRDPDAVDDDDQDDE